MTGDWAGSVQILRLHFDVSEVPVVVLNDINLIVKTFYDVDSLLPDTSDENCSMRDSPAPCRLRKSMIETVDYYE